jgi:hypothetical protein
VSPAEAGRIEIEEPDWKAVFEEECARWPTLPRYLQEDSAFESTLSRWRRFHWTPVVVDKKDMKLPAPMTEGVVELARLGIMPPRSAWNDIPRGDELGYQYDDHCWLSYNREQWRIVSVEDRMLLLRKGFQADEETKQIDLNRARWDKYVESAVEIIEAQKNPS